MEVVDVTPEMQARAALADWSRSGRATKFFGPIDWPEAVRDFRDAKVDFLFSEQGKWYGYNLDVEHLASRPEVQALTKTAYRITLGHTIA